MRQTRVTMKDVAEAASVSKTAVSFAFNTPARLSEATLRNILRVAEELGYAHDPIGRILRTRRTDSLGVLLPQEIDRVLENPHYTHFLQGIGQVCHQEGLTLLLVPPLRGSMLKAIPHAAADGFIVSGLEYDRGEVAALRQRTVPFVVVDSELHDEVASVEIDDAAGMRDLLTHLLALGHRRIAVVAFETDIKGGYTHWRGPARRRMQGIGEALAAYGLTPESNGITVLEAPCTRTGGVRAFQGLWASDTRPTAIVTFSDVIALGVLDAAHRAGVSVPGDLSVTGFDDLAEAAWSRPSLTTIRQPITTKGRLAAEYLVEVVNSRTDGDALPQKRLQTTLLVRESVGYPPVDPGRGAAV